MKRLTKHLFEAKFLGVLTIAYTLCVTIVMLLPLSGKSKVAIPFFDKIVHALIYIGFVFVWLSYFLKTKKKLKGISPILFLLLFIYGIIIEVLQGSFVASRTYDNWDIVANTSGIIIGIVGFYKVKDTFLFKK